MSAPSSVKKAVQIPGEFGFTVYGPGTIQAGFESEDEPELMKGYLVNLPHQCQEWEVAGSRMTDGSDYAATLNDMERFIQQAQEALAALKAMAA